MTLVSFVRCFLSLYIPTHVSTYLGGIKNPFEVRIICKCLLNDFDGTGDICLREVNYLDGHDRKRGISDLAMFRGSAPSRFQFADFAHQIESVLFNQDWVCDQFGVVHLH